MSWTKNTKDFQILVLSVKFSTPFDLDMPIAKRRSNGTQKSHQDQRMIETQVSQFS